MRLATARAVETSKSPLKIPYLLILSSTVLPTGDKTFTYISLWGPVSLKPPQWSSVFLCPNINECLAVQNRNWKSEIDSLKKKKQCVEISYQNFTVSVVKSTLVLYSVKSVSSNCKYAIHIEQNNSDSENQITTFSIICEFYFIYI